MEMNDKFKPENDKEIWFRDTYVIWTMANFNAFMNFCGTEFNLDNAKDCKEWLARDWGVETKEELIELARNLSDFINESANVLEGLKERDIDNYNETLDFVAWDLCRGTQVLGMGFVSEIIDRETMVDESAKIAYFMQKFYTSWEHLMTHYLNGYEDWANDTFDSTQAMVNIQMRKAMYEGIKMNPLVFQVDWNLPIYELPEFTIIENVLLGNDVNERTKSCILQEYNGDATHVIVPDGVIEIRKEAFAKKDFIKEVKLPESVQVIGGCAFADCTALTKINLPESIVKIEEACFWGCTSLENITLPCNLQELGTSALGGNGLVSCTIPESITFLATTFYKCHKLKEVTLPETLKRIGESSFQYCEALTEITIPVGVEYIGVQAFADCPNLEKLNCDNPQFKFAPNTFENSPLENMFAHLNGDEEDPLFGFNIDKDVLMEFTDYKAEEVVIPDGVHHISEKVFENKTRIKKVVLHEQVWSIGASAFAGCTSLEEIVFNGEKIFHIGENAFVGTAWFENLSDEFNILFDKYLIKYTGNQEFVTIPEGVREIVAPAFSESLVGVTLPESLECIGCYAFAGCKNLKEIVIHDDVEDIGEFAFHECTSLEKAVLPDELDSLNAHTFSGCTSLKEVKLPTEIDDIEHLVFKDTPFWETLTDEFTMIGKILLKYNGSGQAVIPDDVVQIAGTAFADNEELTSVVIPDSVEKIGVFAFVNCTNLEQVTFGDSIVEMCKSAFLNTGLKSITLPNSLEVVTELVFAFCRELEEVEISDSVKLIERQAFAYCEKLVEITIPETVDAIEGGAFADCKSLEKLNVLNPDVIVLPGAFEGTKITEEQQEQFSETYNKYMTNVGFNSDDGMYKVQLFARVGDLNKVIEYVIEALGDLLENIAQDGSTIIFELKDTTHFIVKIPELVFEQELFQGYKESLLENYGDIETDKTEVKNGLLRFFTMINSVFVLSFERLDIEERFNFLLNCMIEVTGKAHGLMMLVDGTLVDGEGNKVFTEDGESELDKFDTLVAAESLNIEQEEPTMEDDMRYMTSREYLKSQGIPVMEGFMALSLRKSSVKLRSVEEVCQRVVALFTTAIRAEGLATNEEDTDAIIENLENQFNSDEYYTPDEEAFMDADVDELEEKDIIPFSWNYEGVGILLYALGLFSTRNEPNEIYSPAKLSKIMQKFDSLEDMISQAELMPVELLLQDQDMHMRYHWACIEARINDEEPAADMIEGAVLERHRALNWLLTDVFGDNWDNIQSPA